MIVSKEIKALGKLVQRLRVVDKKFRVFGSEQHKYKFGPTLSEAELKAFEVSNGCKLPEDYRQFLATIGNGGAGPFYGLEPLGTFGRDLSKPFPLAEATKQLSGVELEKVGASDSGVLEFCHQGCCIYSYLVVNGPTYGTIWFGREDFFPTDLSFSIWYRSWAEKALQALKNENKVSLLRVGMSKADVIKKVGGDWRTRKALYGPIWYFEASNIPAQLELDEHGIVIKVNPRQFIVANPEWPPKAAQIRSS